MKRALVLLSIVVAAGCQSKSVDEMSYSEVKQYAAKLHERCLAQGAKPGEEMQLCMNQEAISDETKRRNSVATRKAIGAALSDASESYNRNRPVNCTSTGYGNTVRTTCY